MFQQHLHLILVPSGLHLSNIIPPPPPVAQDLPYCHTGRSGAVPRPPPAQGVYRGVRGSGVAVWFTTCPLGGSRRVMERSGVQVSRHGQEVRVCNEGHRYSTPRVLWAILGKYDPNSGGSSYYVIGLQVKAIHMYSN